MSLEFQDGNGSTFCCEGENAPGSVDEGNASGWSGCDSIHQGGCTIASVSNPTDAAGGGFTNLQVTLEFDNSGGGSEVVYGVGDPIGLLEELSKQNLTPPSGGSIKPSIFKDYVGSKGYGIRNMKISVSDDTMFNKNIITVVTGNIAGVLAQTPLMTRLSSLNPQFYGMKTERYLPMKPAIRLNDTRCLFVTVPAGQTCSITFS